MTFLVYLAGPITGLTYNGATSWRDGVKQQLFEMSLGRIECLSPMRHKDYLVGETKIGDCYDGKVLSSQRGITARDRLDTTRADLVLVNVLGATEKSLGTTMEIAWADLARVPVVLAMEEAGNPHDHAMIRECCPFRVPTVEEAVATAARILLP